MKKFFRLLCCIMLAALVLGAFAGCHENKDVEDKPFTVPDESADNGFDTSKNYEITFWAKNDTNINQVAVYKKAVADFEALYPNIKVTLRLYTDYGRIYNDVITNIPTKTTPNVCITYPDHIATYKTGKNVVVPLENLFNDERYGFGGTELRFDGPRKDELVSKFLNECIVDGEYYAIPFVRSTEACYVNKTFVEKLGYTLPEVLTWDFIWEVSQKAVEKGADGKYLVNGKTVMIPFLYKSTDNMMIQMLKQKGADYSTDRGEIGIFNDTTEDILTTIAEKMDNKLFSTFKISSYPANMLNAGECIFAVDSTAGATWMGGQAPLLDIDESNLVQFETVVMPVPQYDPSSPKMISQGPSICIFNKEDAGEVIASWLFAQFLLTDDVQISYATTEGYVPVTEKAQNSEIYRDYLAREGEDNDYYYDIKIKATKLLIENTDNTFVTPVFNGSASLRNAAGQMIEEVVKSKNRKETVDEAYFDDLYNDMIKRYNLSDVLGELKAESVIFLSVLAGVWVVLIVYFVKERIRNLKK